MKLSTKLLLIILMVFSYSNITGQSKNSAIENALLIADQNKNQLGNVQQLLVVYNEQPESFTSVFVALEKKDDKWIVKQEPITAGIGKNGFALSNQKIEGDGKSPTGIFRLGKLFSYEKQTNTLLENQQTTKDDKWIDDVNSPDYNKHVSGDTDAKSYENLLLSNDAYKYCTVIEYNTNPVVKGKGSAIFFHLATKVPNFTSGCIAINEEYMKSMIDWLDPKQNPTIIMGNLDILKTGM
ncbi:MAG: L,D-transpeptidase family protein [Flavobacterium sp.]|uniref:L,D-transpeptidase family protein n=1 Tax=Flavobacterium sp. TaxID=239 RepID=UPI0026054F76|nr:L,D-transpeptidase family protein [Flavobacterium sp.]MDD5149251.1 L,D-transpeptidase family protein [Flavobacterium sp.]